ncbi:MAG: hypothetical protein AAGD22_15155 [Verrucomicrobiota bacterium]
MALGEERGVEEIVDQIENISVEKYRYLQGDLGNESGGDGELWVVLQACAGLRAFEAWTVQEQREFVGALGKYLPGETAQRLLAELAQALSREKAALVASMEADLEQFRENSEPVILSAETSSELDAILLGIGALKRRILSGDRRDTKLQRLATLADQYLEGSAIFQDYLMELELDEPRRARYRLNDISEIEWVGPPLISRSEVQLRTKVDPSVAGSGRMEQSLDSILSSVRDVKDLDQAIVAVEDYRDADLTNYDEVRRALVRLGDAKDAVHFGTASYSNFEQLKLVKIPSLLDVRDALQIQVLGQVLDVPMVVDRAPGATYSEWLRDLGNEFLRRGEWERARRAFASIGYPGMTGYVSGAEPISAARLAAGCGNLQSGENLEKSGFPALAVRSYLRAVDRSTEGPSEVALSRLKAIQESDPKNYEAGIQFYLDSIPPGNDDLPNELIK